MIETVGRIISVDETELSAFDDIILEYLLTTPLG
jgi:hypothetical protein